MQPKVTCLTVEGLERYATELKDIASVRRLAVTERLRRARVVLSADHGADYEDARFEPAASSNALAVWRSCLSTRNALRTDSPAIE